MLRCADRSFYVGHTDELETRLAHHEHGTYPGYTRSRRPVKLVYACEFESRQEAIEREMQLEGWSRAKKLALIDGDWDRIVELSRSFPLPLRLSPHRTRRVLPFALSLSKGDE